MIENLKKELTDRDSIIQQLRKNISINMESIARLRAEKGEIEEKVGINNLRGIISRLYDEKKDLETKNTSLKEKIDNFAEMEKELKNFKEITHQLQEEKVALESKQSSLEGKVIELQKERENLIVQLSQLEKFTTENESLEREKGILLQQVTSFEELVKTLTASQENSRQFLQELEEIKQKNDILQRENQNLKTKLDDVKSELDESLELHQFQADKIRTLESKLVTASKTPINTKISSATSETKVKQYFNYVKDEFVKGSKKYDGIKLELDSLKRKWIITIGPKVSLIEKNKGLRLARSLTTSGLRITNGKLVGKGFNLTIIGE